MPNWVDKLFGRLEPKPKPKPPPRSNEELWNFRRTMTEHLIKKLLSVDTPRDELTPEELIFYREGKKLIEPTYYKRLVDFTHQHAGLKYDRGGVLSPEHAEDIVKSALYLYVTENVRGRVVKELGNPPTLYREVKPFLQKEIEKAKELRSDYRSAYDEARQQGRDR